ncbi:M42 family metallopeptidase [Thermovenabulum gondwanense]|uniref:Putative aminopeptidase YsdC n=1 Tax=Thermovenabulum gondwanense TaxID=520767 RepID=A0A162M8G3_9FIRM|nr:M42 family metallopeptidase [Thermovenabulum gondwanense]KYO64522.1 putative aminopeptidase YsdC [Thermovenabulum gondwanense]
MKDLLKNLTESYGPSGNEEKIRNVIKELVEPYSDEIKIDAMGNLIVRKKGPGKKLMFAAHMDEIGLIVTNIDEKGFIRFSNIGGVSPYVLLGERVIFENGTVGVIGVEKLEDIKELKMKKLFIDIGASSKEEAMEKVKIGDMATYYRECTFLGKSISAKSLDDRAGCAVLIKALKEVKNPKYDLYFVFTTQEEVGTRGARTSAYAIEPDLAIAVDVTLCGDTPEGEKMAVELGKGPAVKIKDMSVLSHPEVKQLLIDTAEKNKIPYQKEVLDMGGTDAGAIHLTKEGVPSGGIAIPTRYVHTPSEMVNLDDLENTVKLILALIEQ